MYKRQELQSADAAVYNDLSDEMQAYMDYIYDTVLTANTGIILTGEINSSDEMYISWNTEGDVSLHDFLNYAITQNWIDTSKLGNSSYSSSTEIFDEILTYLEEYLNEDSGFDKLLYEYLIKSGSVTGAQILSLIHI